MSSLQSLLNPISSNPPSPVALVGVCQPGSSPSPPPQLGPPRRDFGSSYTRYASGGLYDAASDDGGEPPRHGGDDGADREPLRSSPPPPLPPAATPGRAPPPPQQARDSAPPSSSAPAPSAPAASARPNAYSISSILSPELPRRTLSQTAPDPAEPAATAYPSSPWGVASPPSRALHSPEAVRASSVRASGEVVSPPPPPPVKRSTINSILLQAEPEPTPLNALLRRESVSQPSQRPPSPSAATARSPVVSSVRRALSPRSNGAPRDSGASQGSLQDASIDSPEDTGQVAAPDTVDEPVADTPGVGGDSMHDDDDDDDDDDSMGEPEPEHENDGDEEATETVSASSPEVAITPPAPSTNASMHVEEREDSFESPPLEDAPPESEPEPSTAITNAPSPPPPQPPSQQTDAARSTANHDHDEDMLEAAAADPTTLPNGHANVRFTPSPPASPAWKSQQSLLLGDYIMPRARPQPGAMTIAPLPPLPPKPKKRPPPKKKGIATAKPQKKKRKTSPGSDEVYGEEEEEAVPTPPPEKTGKKQPKSSTSKSKKAPAGANGVGGGVGGKPVNGKANGTTKRKRAKSPSKKVSAAGEELYCICRKPDTGKWMIACDGCEDWFHGECVDISEDDGELIDKYYCVNCTTDSPTSQTTWLRKCRLPTCRLPAAVRQKPPSKFCTPAHGIEFFKRQTLRSTLSASQLATLVSSVPNVREFHRLGERIPTPPPASSDLEDGGDELETTGYDPGELERLREIEDERKSLEKTQEKIGMRRRYLAMAQERKKRVWEDLKRDPETASAAGKEICGYDENLSLDDHQLAELCEGPGGFFELGGIRIGSGSGGGGGGGGGETGGTAESQDAAVKEAPKDAAAATGREGVCIKKKCLKHGAWARMCTEELVMQERVREERLAGLRAEERRIVERRKRRVVRDEREGTIEVVC